MTIHIHKYLYIEKGIVILKQEGGLIVDVTWTDIQATKTIPMEM